MINVIKPENFKEFARTEPFEESLDAQRHVFETSGRTLFEGDVPDNAIISVTDGSLEVQGNIGDNVQITMTNSSPNKIGLLSRFFNKTVVPPKFHSFSVHGTTGNHLTLNAPNLGLARLEGKVGRGVTINGNISSSRIHMGAVGSELRVENVKNFNAFNTGERSVVKAGEHVSIGILGSCGSVYSKSMAIAHANSGAYLIATGYEEYKYIDPKDLPKDLKPLIAIQGISPDSFFDAIKSDLGKKIYFGQIQSNTILGAEDKNEHAFSVIDGNARLRGRPQGKFTVIDGGLTIPNSPVYG